MTIPVEGAGIDFGLLGQANLVATQISAFGGVSEGRLIDAVQLWRVSQLILEGTMDNGGSIELQKLQDEATKLQHSIEKVIPHLLAATYEDAIKMDTLRDGLARWAKAGAYLSLYPNNGTPATAELLQKIGYNHERVRQELLQKAQTRYNLWACGQIKNAWVDIKDVNNPVGTSDNQKFFHTCDHFLAPIDPSLLGMSTGELYREVLGFVRERISLEDFQELVKEIESGEKLSFDDLG